MASMTTDHTPGDTGAGALKRPCALLWDESHLWGVMARRALGEAGLPYDLLRSEDIRGGALSRYRMIFVPGGWASNKIGALGEPGSEEIRRFVAAGGGYLGICGGAGMATESGLGLLPVRRRPSKERVPSFSGPIRLSCGEHAIWQDVETPVFSAWWPSQFLVTDRHVRVLARYEEAQADAFSSDVPVADGGVVGWPDLERRYGILLDPARLRGEPGVVEGRFESGRVVLSLVHFDTPGDRNGAVVLRNLWRYLASCSPCHPPTGGGGERGASLRDVPQEALQSLEEIQAAVAGLIAAGARHFLWYWRNPLLLQWRRGIRGLEYSTLAVMIGEVARCLRSPDAPDLRGRWALPPSIDPSRLSEDLREIRGQLVPFCEKAKRLLVRERFAMMAAPLSPVECADREISSLRAELFAAAMSHGGLFKRLIDRVDSLLYDLIRGE
jgi:putative intracellular protease/amidase